jgi:hypothetical protein
VETATVRPERVHIGENTPEWRAWQRHLGRSMPLDKQGSGIFPAGCRPCHDLARLTWRGVAKGALGGREGRLLRRGRCASPVGAIGQQVFDVEQNLPMASRHLLVDCFRYFLSASCYVRRPDANAAGFGIDQPL